MRRDVEQAAAGGNGKGARAAPTSEVAQGEASDTSGRHHAARGERTEERVRMSKRRATIAKRLVEAQSTAAMLTTFNEVDMSAVMALRERHKADVQGAARRRARDCVVLRQGRGRRAAGVSADQRRDPGRRDGPQALLRHRRRRRRDRRAGRAGAARRRSHVLRRDRAADSRLRQAAEDGTLSLADLKGGTFTITNGGVFGSLLSTPILNPPQVGILGLHAIKERPVAVDGQVVLRPMMYTALTYDHRIVDGSEAVRFLVRVKELVEDPGALLLD